MANADDELPDLVGRLIELSHNPRFLNQLIYVVMEGPASPAELLMIQVVENALREDLRPVEQARAYRALMDLNGWSTHQVARELAVDQSSVVKALALLNLPGPVQDRVEQGELAPATAYEVGKLDDPAEQAELAARVVAEGLSRAETAEAVKARRAPMNRSSGKGRGRKATARTFRKAAGYAVTFECPRGVDAEGIRAALAEVLARLDAEAAA